MGLKLDSIWGVEIGANGFNAVQLKKIKGNVVVSSFHVFSYSKSIENEEEEFVDMARQGLMSLFGEGVIKKNDSVFVSIPGRHIFSRPIELPPMDMSKFHELIKYEASQQIPHNLDEVVWDYHLDTSDDNVSAMLFAAHKDQVNRIIGLFAEAGLQIVGIQSSNLAILNYFRHDVDYDKSCVILDVKSKNIDFIVNDGLRFWQRNIARGGDDINKALMTKFKIPFEQAEELKRNMSKGKQAEKILQVVQPVFKSMTNEIQRSIGHYVNQHEEVQIQDAFLLGNAHRMKALIQYFKKNMRLKLNVVKELGRLAEYAQVDLEAFNKKHGDLVVPLGLALQGLNECMVTINLLPPEIVAARVAKKRRKWLVMAAGLFLAAGSYNLYAHLETKAELKALDKEGPKVYKQWVGMLTDFINKEKNKVAPARSDLSKWKRHLRDRRTYFKRDAHIIAIDQINKVLHNPQSDMSNRIFIKEILIEKVQNLEYALPDCDIKEVKMDDGPATMVFKITILGSFFAKDTEQEDLQYIIENITKPLDANSDYFQDMRMEERKTELDPDLLVEICQYSIVGYFVPQPQAPSQTGPKGKKKKPKKKK